MKEERQELMTAVKDEKVWERQKYETIAWLVIGVVHNEILCVMKMEHSQNYMIL